MVPNSILFSLKQQEGCPNWGGERMRGSGSGTKKKKDWESGRCSIDRRSAQTGEEVCNYIYSSQRLEVGNLKD